MIKGSFVCIPLWSTFTFYILQMLERSDNVVNIYLN